MTEKQIKHLLDLGENVSIEFKRCSGNIGFSDKLGSGVRKIFKYSHIYSGENPEFIERDIFRIIVPLNELYTFDGDDSNSVETDSHLTVADSCTVNDDDCTVNIKNCPVNDDNCTVNTHSGIQKTFDFICNNPHATINEIHTALGVSERTVKNHIALLKKQFIKRIGSDKKGYWEILEPYQQTKKTM